MSKLRLAQADIDNQNVKMRNDLAVDAIFVMDSGIWFEYKATYPHENFITLQWQLDEDDITVEFVYFGHYKNRVIYHTIRIEEKSLLL